MVELLDKATFLIARGYDVENIKWNYEIDDINDYIKNQYEIETEIFTRKKV